MAQKNNQDIQSNNYPTKISFTENYLNLFGDFAKKVRK